MAAYKILAIAAASGRLGYALLEDNRLIDWGISQVAARSTSEAASSTAYWIEYLKPEVVVTESIGNQCRKRGNTISILQAINVVADDAPQLNVTVSKNRAYQNKYEEAQALAEQFPELSSRLADKPAIWLNEPRRMIIFEALSMALQVRQIENQ